MAARTPGEAGQPLPAEGRKGCERRGPEVWVLQERGSPGEGAGTGGIHLLPRCPVSEFVSGHPPRWDLRPHPRRPAAAVLLACVRLVVLRG